MRYIALHDYGKAYYKYSDNGYGIISTAHNVRVCEGLNSHFYLTFKMLVTDPLFKRIADFSVFVVDANPKYPNQKFFLTDMKCNNLGIVEIKAIHKTFELSRDVIHYATMVDRTCHYAISEVCDEGQTDEAKDYVSESDLEGTATIYPRCTTINDALFGAGDSVINVYSRMNSGKLGKLGAHIIRDNKDRPKLSIMKSRGTDTGIILAYGTNLAKYESVYESANFCNAIYPFAIDPVTNYYVMGDRNIISPKWVRGTPLIYNTKDFSDRFDGENRPTVTKLEEMAAQYFRDSFCDEISVSYSFDFEKMRTTGDFFELPMSQLSNVCLGDWVTIKHPLYGLDMKAFITEYEYDPYKREYTKLVIGNVRRSILKV